ncbi:MAG: hypothetical protein WCD18_21720 [Thermosynechococcaceae cyanobacterium]
MVATLEQLHQDLSRLKTTSAAIAQDLRQLLAEYLRVLGIAVQKQLVLSTFQLCTEVYPEAFLQLSVSERETLQRQVRDLGRQAIATLAETAAPLQDLADAAEIDPTQLLDAWETVEHDMMKALQDSSLQVNQLLQETQVMQIRSLDKLLDMAVKADDSGRSITNPPHLLKALIEPKNLEEDEDLNPVVAIYLQLEDLEFTDSTLMSWRQKIRPLLQKLSQVQQSFAQKQEEQLSAEAIAAWKSTWVAEDSLLGGGATD